MEFALLLGFPLIGAIALGFFGARRWAPELNVAASLATFVAEQGTRMFLEEEGFAPKELERWEREARAEAADEAVLLRLRGDLDALYRSRLSDEAKLRRKRELFATRAEHDQAVVVDARRAPFEDGRDHGHGVLLGRCRDGLHGRTVDGFREIEHGSVFGLAEVGRREELL